MHDQTTTILSLIDMYKHSKDKLAKEFAAYASNKSIPQMERWTMFQRAPDDIKQHDKWVPSLDFAGGYEVVLGEVYSGNKQAVRVHADRHQHVSVDRVIEKIVDEHEYNSSAYEFDEDQWREFISNAIEHFLQRNLGSFTYDW